MRKLLALFLLLTLTSCTSVGNDMMYEQLDTLNCTLFNLENKCEKLTETLNALNAKFENLEALNASITELKMSVDALTKSINKVEKLEQTINILTRELQELKNLMQKSER